MSNLGPDEAADLEIVKKKLRSHGLTMQPFSKAERKAGKTPDFRIVRGKTLLAYGELKSPRDDWLDQKLDQAAPGQIVGGARADPVFNRIARQIEKAAEQFDAVNPNREVPNILFLVNHDKASNVGDLRETVTGQFFSADGTRHDTNKRISEGKIKYAKLGIDAYSWFDVKTGLWSKPIFGESKSEHLDAVCAMFGIDKTGIAR